MATAVCTVITTSEVLVSWESFALSRNTYVPAVVKNAWVIALFALLKLTAAGPLTWLHWIVSVPLGLPSSVALPLSVTALAGNVMVWLGPASTTGAWLGGRVHCTSTRLELAAFPLRLVNA